MDTTELAGNSSGIDETVETDAGETRSFEDIAKEKGWKPKEDYSGEPDAWVGAEEFIKRQPLFDKIKTQNKRLKELEKTVEALGKHYQTNIQQAKEKAIADLKSERREAIELGEVDRVEQIDKRIEDVHKIPDPVAPPPVLASEIEQFVEEQRDWFNKDQEMTQFAISFNEAYLKTHPGDLGKSLDETLKAVKRAYPEKFANQRRTAPPSVEGAAVSTKTDSKYSVSRLTHEQKLVYNQLVKTHKQMSHEDYFKSLEDAGYLEG